MWHPGDIGGSARAITQLGEEERVEPRALDLPASSDRGHRRFARFHSVDGTDTAVGIAG
ncbi:MAG: hypothetical protein ACR2MB_14290 [Acidimicrobiales bacterium]